MSSGVKNYMMTSEIPKPVNPIRLKDPLVEDLGVPAASVTAVHFPGAIPEKYTHLRLDLENAQFTAELGALVKSATEAGFPEKGWLLLTTHAPFDEVAIASMRRALWPTFHVVRVYRLKNQQYVDRLDPDGWQKLNKQFPSTWGGSGIAVQRRAALFAPDAVAKKFDKNAAGWSGDPKSPLYAHHRWMRRLVAELAEPKQGERTLDAGCGAGWVGIEAAKLGAQVSSFDPSPEMGKHVADNAASEKVQIEFKTGFVEKPPFGPAAGGAPFSLVLNSGVISFSPDPKAYLAALDACVAPGGRLVIGDLNPQSRGMLKRQTERPVLPLREMNALKRAEVISLLEGLGYTITARRYYQLTDPTPQLMHFCANKLGGLGCGWLLSRNQKAASHDSDDAAGFDSWLLRATKRS